MSPIFVPKDRKSLFRQFLAGMYDAVVITDPDGHILEINPRAEEYFACQQDEIVDRFISIFVPGMTPDIVQRLRRGLDEGRHIVLDSDAKRKDGSKFPCEIAISEIDLKEPGDLVFTVRNLEKRRRTREMLRAKEAAFGISHSALFVCDADGKFTHVNKAFCDLFGLSGEEEARSHSFCDLMGDFPLPDNFEKALGGESTSVGIVAQTDDGGDDEELDVSLAPVRTGRAVTGVAGSVFKV